MNSTRNAPGTGKTFGPYRLVQLLGQGGMAKVWMAQKNEASGMLPRFAVKVIHDHLSGQERFQDLFQREARIHVGLNHPNLVKAFEVVREGDRLALVMELLDGSLDNVTAKWTPEQVAEMIRQAAFALDYLHHPPEKETRSPLIHRDLSPSNLLLDCFGTLKIGDFGIARLSYSSGLTAFTPGKPFYMAPEQFEGQVTSASDIYSLGVVALEKWKGRELFRGEQKRETRHERTLEALESLTAIHEELVGLLREMLQNDPKSRPTAARIVERLSAPHWKGDALALKGMVAKRNRSLTTPSASPVSSTPVMGIGKPPKMEAPKNEVTPTGKRLRFPVLGLILVVVAFFLFLSVRWGQNESEAPLTGFGSVVETVTPEMYDALVVVSAKTRHDVFLDGKPVGVTPVNLRLPVGRHVVAVRKGDQPMRSKTFVAVRGANAELYFK